MKVRATKDFLHATRVFLQRLRAAPCDPKHAPNASAMDRTRWRRSRDVTYHSPKLRAHEPRSLPTSSSGARSPTPPSDLLCHELFATKSTLIEALSSKAARRHSKCCSICTGTTEPSHHHVLKPHAVLATHLLTTFSRRERLFPVMRNNTVLTRPVFKGTRVQGSRNPAFFNCPSLASARALRNRLTARIQNTALKTRRQLHF